MKRRRGVDKRGDEAQLLYCTLLFTVPCLFLSVLFLLPVSL